MYKRQILKSLKNKREDFEVFKNKRECVIRLITLSCQIKNRDSHITIISLFFFLIIPMVVHLYTLYRLQRVR